MTCLSQSHIQMDLLSILSMSGKTKQLIVWLVVSSLDQDSSNDIRQSGIQYTKHWAVVLLYWKCYMPNKGFTLSRSKVAEILFRYPRHWFCFLSLVKDMALLMLSLVWKQELEVWKHSLNKCIVVAWCCKAYKRAVAQRELIFPYPVKFYFWIRASRAVWHSYHSAELWRPKGIYAELRWICPSFICIIYFH